MHLEVPVKTPTGQPQFFSGSYVPRFSADGQIDGLIGYFQNMTERKRTEDALKFLVQCGDPASGEDFFRSLARYLGQNLGMDFVCIDRLEDGLLAATTLAVHFDGKFEDNMSYTLKDTPCGDVVGKSICCFSRGVRHLFPKDTVLQEMKAESYLGTTLWSSDGRPIGLIAVIGRAPLADTALPASILQLVAVRAAGELERRQAEAALRQSEERYRSLFSTLIEGFCIIEVLFDAENRPVDYRFLEINPAFEAQTGLHDALGKTICELAPEHEAHWCELYGQVALTGQPIRFINEAKALHRWFDVSAYRIGGPESRRVAILFNDITQRQQAEETIRQANVILEQRVAARTHQLASVNTDLHDRMDAYQRLEAEVARLVEAERVQLGMELHDNLCQQIAATAMLTSTLAKRLQDQNSPLADMAARLVTSLGQAGDDAHALARGLLPVQVEADGLMVSLAGLAQRIADMQGVACAFECAAPVPVENNATATHLFRIAQEAVQNALKHGQARHIVLTLTNHEGMTLTIFDDGRGIPPQDQRRPGSGLRIMAYRARVIGAELSVEPAPAGGTLVRCALRKGPAPL
jgi:PAS domain S-box-containing protein